MKILKTFNTILRKIFRNYRFSSDFETHYYLICRLFLVLCKYFLGFGGSFPFPLIKIIEKYSLPSLLRPPLIRHPWIPTSHLWERILLLFTSLIRNLAIRHPILLFGNRNKLLMHCSLVNPTLYVMCAHPVM